MPTDTLANYKHLEAQGLLIASIWISLLRSCICMVHRNEKKEINGKRIVCVRVCGGGAFLGDPFLKAWRASLCERSEEKQGEHSQYEKVMKM